MCQFVHYLLLIVILKQMLFYVQSFLIDVLNIVANSVWLIVLTSMSFRSCIFTNQKQLFEKTIDVQ